MESAKPKAGSREVDAEISVTMAKWIVDGLVQYGPAITIAASMTALASAVVAAGMPRDEFLDVVGESYDKTAANLKDIEATPLGARVLAQLAAIKLGTYRRIFCSCGVVVLQCACPGEKKEATLPNACASCRKEAVRP